MYVEIHKQTQTQKHRKTDGRENAKTDRPVAHLTCIRLFFLLRLPVQSLRRLMRFFRKSFRLLPGATTATTPAPPSQPGPALGQGSVREE